jgi:hypothetical protein
MMEAKTYFIMLIYKAQNLKDTQLFGKQSPRVHLSIGNSTSERAFTSTKEKGGCDCLWNETIHIELKKNVEFLLIEVKSGSELIGMGRIPSSQVSEFPRSQDLQLTDQGGKKAGLLTCSVQKFHGDLNELHAHAHALKSGQAQAIVTPAANMFLNSIKREPATQQNVNVSHSSGFQQPVSHSGGFQQPVSHSGGFQQPALHSGGFQQQHSGGFQEPMSHSGGFQQSSAHTRPPLHVDTSGTRLITHARTVHCSFFIV